VKCALHVDGISVECILGDRPEERLRPVAVCVDAEISFSMARCAATDMLEDAVDYTLAANAVSKALVEGRFRLVESAAYAVARTLMALDGRIDAVSVSVSKPGGIDGVRSVSAEISLDRDDVPSSEGAA